MWGVYSPNFGKILIKISVLGSYTLIIAPMGATHPCQISPPSVLHIAPAG